MLSRVNVQIIVSILLAATATSYAEPETLNITGKKELIVKRGYTKEAKACVECHSKETPGIVADWKDGRMAHVAVSCYDCHNVKKSSPMASQCSGLKGSETYISAMVSPKTCARCHPVEVEQFSHSGHAKLAGAPVVDKAKFKKLMYHYEGGEFRDGKGSTAARSSGCQMCHGTKVELGSDNKPINNTWPGGVGTRYPDGGIGNCTVCHTRHSFSIAEARKPEACGACHLGPDHPDIEIYESSKHGQIYATEHDEWNFESAPGTWEPGEDFRAPTCAACHMSGVGELKTTHNVNERLHWDLVHPRSEVRTGERGDGVKGRPLMMKVCKNCHGPSHTKTTMSTLDDSVALYNEYYDGAQKMMKELKEKGLLKKDMWSDGFQELNYFLWHHTGRRARHGAAMNGPDYAHWHGFFQVFQVYKDMQAIYDYRIKHNKIEEVSSVMNSGPE